MLPQSTLHYLGIPDEARLQESRYWYDRARRVLAGGVSSSARATSIGPRPFPLYLAQAHGAHVWDADGNEFIDYLLGYGSSILGHAEDRWVEILKGQLGLGTMLGTCNPIEVQLAEQFCAMVPCADLVRFANSGSEAIAGAVRAARGYTGREMILKFEGHYHGWTDQLALSNRPDAAEAGPLQAPHAVVQSRGIPRGVREDVVVCPWNEPGILRSVLDRHEGRIAAIIAEPIVANNACIMPEEGYLELLREETARRGIVLIFDEIVTGFRIAPGGAQAVFGVEPDLAVYSKALGGGLPLSAFAGRRAIMDLVASNTVRHGGTYNGNPLCAASALHVLERIATDNVCDALNEAGHELMAALRKAGRRHRVPCIVQGTGAMFQVVFGSDKIRLRHYRDLLNADMNRFAEFRMALLEEGVHANNSGLACWFLSAAHTAQDIHFTTAAIEKAFASLAR